MLLFTKVRRKEGGIEDAEKVNFIKLLNLS
jgi:hypothetical protein